MKKSFFACPVSAEAGAAAAAAIECDKNVNIRNKLIYLNLSRRIDEPRELEELECKVFGCARCVLRTEQPAFLIGRIKSDYR